MTNVNMTSVNMTAVNMTNMGQVNMAPVNAAMAAPQKRRVFISARHSMIEHITLMAARKAMQYNGRLQAQRQKFKAIIKVDNKIRTNERHTLN